MKMDEMNRYLEIKGFEVERNYIKGTSTYEFTISRDGHHYTSYFEYDASLSPDRRDNQQRAFMSILVSNFTSLYGNGGQFVHTSLGGTGIGIVKSETDHFEINFANAIKKVIFSAPATIILWEDGTKTVVKCSENDTYSPEMGMAMAICKKALGNKGNYSKVFKKWLPKEEEKDHLITFGMPADNYSASKMAEAFEKLSKHIPRRWPFV